jgi:hypothetical protein
VACAEKYHSPRNPKAALSTRDDTRRATARCSGVGWDVSENTIAKIEAQIRCVTDGEIVFLAKALRVNVQDVFQFH